MFQTDLLQGFIISNTNTNTNNNNNNKSLQILSRLTFLTQKCNFALSPKKRQLLAGVFNLSVENTTIGSKIRLTYHHIETNHYMLNTERICAWKSPKGFRLQCKTLKATSAWQYYLISNLYYAKRVLLYSVNTKQRKRLLLNMYTFKTTHPEQIKLFKLHCLQSIPLHYFLPAVQLKDFTCVSGTVLPNAYYKL